MGRTETGLPEMEILNEHCSAYRKINERSRSQIHTGAESYLHRKVYASGGSSPYEGQDGFHFVKGTGKVGTVRREVSAQGN